VQYDLRVQVANPMEAEEPSLLGVPMFVAIVSALRGQPPEVGAVIAGDMSVQGNVEGIDAAGEVLLIARENGALKIALPALCEADVSSCPRELLEDLSLCYYTRPSELITRILQPPVSLPER
jgi:predicted ATP-dependent Lon-type protease